MMSTMKSMKSIVTQGRGTFAIGAAALVAALVGAALATPPSGIISAAVLARAGFTYPVDILLKFKAPGERQEVIHIRDARDTVMQQILIGPGGNTGWHSHPGPVVVLVKAGELTVFSGEDARCAGRTYSAGQSFVDPGQGHVHIAYNSSQSENVELLVTYFDVPPGTSFRLDAPSPGNCSF